MIVISHAWEFVPSGSSSQLLNQLNLPVTSSQVQNSKTDGQSTTNQQQQQKLSESKMSAPQFYLHKSHLHRFYSNQNLNQPPSGTPEDNNSSLSDISFAYLHKSPLISNINFELSANEKWHLKQINEFCETEIYVKDNRVILSYGVDNESKCIRRTFTFDSPVVECNWFNFKTDSNETSILKDCLCAFESQKIHVYSQTGSDYHVPLPFKLKNCWKLRDGILMERQIDSCVNSYFRSNQSHQLFFTLSNPLNDIKPILCKSSSGESKGIYLKENSKQLIVDVIESLNIVLVFSLLNNVHYLYRITENLSEDSEVVNNLLNGTIVQQSEQLDTTQPGHQNLNVSSLITPLPRPDSQSCLSLSVNQSKKRLSVSPIISTYSFYNKLNVNSPLVTNSNTTVTTTTSSTITTTVQTATTTTTNTLISAHQHYFQRNFSPMAALSRSPSCSSSPAINSVRRTSVYQAPARQTSNTLQVNPPSANFMTPLLEVNNQPYNATQFRTPLNMNQQNTPLNYKRSFTPFLNNSSLNQSEAFQVQNDVLFEQAQPEYCLELIWTEPVIVAGDSSFNEKASKFFQIQDLYNQKYLVYLMPAKSQLRCLKIDQDNDQVNPTNQLSYIPAKDAVYVETRNLMIIIDTQYGLFVYSGLTKLCKLQLHNILWSNQISLPRKSEIFQSPIITPIKSKLFSKPNLVTTNVSTGEILQTSIDETFKTPKNTNIQSKLLSSSVGKALHLPQCEYKSLNDSTGSHFNIKLSDNRILRVNLTEPSNHKLVNLCLEAFKYTLNKEIFYEIIQQWFIHRYNIGESIKNQLSLFLYLILNLCGCFDMGKIEQEIPFLSVSKHRKIENETIDETEELIDESKRPKCSLDEPGDDDWEFMLNDPMFQKFITSEKNLKEFDLPRPVQSDEPITSIPSRPLNENIKTPGSFSRQKRSISSTLTGLYPSSGSLGGSGGILYPYLKNILYTLHLVYEETKLYRSLNHYCEDLIQILYLLANEIGLPLYMNYYEMEQPSLLKFKGKKSSTPATPGMPNKNSVNYLILQDPPNLNKFLFNLLNDSHIKTPFPIINTVTKRILKTIKLYAIISLCKQKNEVNYDDFLNQCYFKINFSGFQSVDLEPHPYMDYSLKFNFKNGDKYLQENIFSKCLEMGLCTINEIYDYPLFVLFPILESIKWSRDNPCFSWPPFAFDLIGRNDLAILKSNSDELSLEMNQLSEQEAEEKTQVYQRPIWNNMSQSMAKSSQPETSLCLNVIQSVKKDDDDGMDHVNNLETLKCRFNEDLRIKELRTCLQTTRAIQIKLNQGPDVSDHDFLEEEEKFLSCICVRTMSLPVGRGIFTLHTINPIPTEPVVIPELNLKGKSLTKKTTIDLTRVEVPTNMTYWPMFHNGVASGLTINAQAKDLSNSWIKSHLAKNFELTNEQAGFLYGLGLTGHLANFSMLNIYDALSRRHDLTNIALLLGLAASKIGSMDLSVTRLISMHIRSLMPPVEIELETPYNIQISALLSLGLVYVKTANKHMSYVLLKEIGRLPGNETDKDLHSLDREAYSLTAGLALGLILLEKGKKSLTIMDSTFTDELYHYMVGGHRDKDNASGYSTNFTSTNTNPTQTNNENNFTNTNNNFRSSNSSYIREGESINTNVTCPGATIALGLIYFNSCDRLISEWFAPPDSAFLLDSIRPDFLLLRVLSRNLIMWKHILPCQEWLLSQLSSLLKVNIKSDKVLNEKFSHLIKFDKPEEIKVKKTVKKTVVFKLEKHVETEEDDLSDSECELIDDLNDNTDEDDNIVVDQDKPKTSKKKSKTHLLGDLIQFDDVENEDFFDEEMEMIETKRGKKTRKIDEDDYEDLGSNFDTNSSDSTTSGSSNNNLIDEETRTEAFRHIIAGSCMSIGLKFAGTFNNDAYQTLLFWANYFTELNDAKLSTENCLCVIVLSLSIVMAGSGDLEVMRICRYLRSRVGPNYSHVTYGSQMAINMALSLLFMGGGRYTLKTDSLSIALMLCAFYPAFPVDSNDNRFHLQAFRHLYVLASEPRLLLSKDVDTGEFCYVPIEITLKSSEHYDEFKYQQMAPCILPELNKIERLKILGPRYYPISFKQSLHFNELKNILISELLVKQKNGYFSYSDDPKDEKAFNIRNFLNKIIVPHKITPDLLEQITNEEHINQFAKILNKTDDMKLNSKTNRLLKLIYESVVQETFDFVGIILVLDKEAQNPTSQFIQEIKLIEKFYQAIGWNEKSLITKEFLYSTINSIETKLRNKIKNRHDLISCYLNNKSNDDLSSLIHFIVLNEINKSEIEYFSKCESFADLLIAKNVSIEKLLRLYQLFKSN